MGQLLVVIGGLCVNPTMPETPTFLIQAAHEQAIQALIVRVNWAIDHGDMDALVSCLHRDVTFVRPDGQELQGAKAVRDAYARRDPNRITRHLLSNVHLRWSSSDRVQAHSSVLLWTGRQSDEATASGRPADPVQKLGEHRDEFTHQEGRWWLLKRQSEFVFFVEPVS